jgi:hypothetical protein
MAYVSGDMHVMKDLKDKFEPDPGTVEWDREQERLRLEREGEEMQAKWEAEHAAQQAAKAEAAKAEKA